VALDDYHIADGTALNAQLHQASSVFCGESYVDETGKSMCRETAFPVG
jgi:hypothetical protein